MDINSKRITELINEIAIEHDLKPEVVRRIIISEFECVRANMKKVDSYNDFFPRIKLPYLFEFKVLPNRRRFYVKKSRKIIEKNVRDSQGETTD